MSGAASVVQMVLSLLAVVAIILGLAWMTRRMQGLRPGAPSELRVRATLAVGMKERVVLIEAQGQRFLIGVAPGGVSLISPLIRSSLAGEGQAEGGVPSDAERTPPGPDSAEAAVPQGERARLSFTEAFALQLNKRLGR